MSAQSPRKKKARNLLLFAAAVAAAILLRSTWDLYAIARLPPPHNNSSTNDPVAARLEIRVRQLSEKIGRRNYQHRHELESAAEFIRAEFNKAGYAVQDENYSVRAPEGPEEFPMHNLVATLPGDAPDAPILVIGAHYDTAPNTPGADDNATGIAGLIELAQRLHGVKSGIEIRFVAFSTEEPPFFGSEQMGSAHAARLLKVEGRRVLGMISLEMLGFYNDAKGSQRYPFPLSFFYPDRANFIAAVSNLSSKTLLAGLLKGYAPPHGTPMIKSSLPELIGEIGLSDHKSYWNEGFPALMISDTAFLRNPHYHGPTDTPEKLDYLRMADVINGLATALRNYAVGCRGHS